MKAKKLLPFLVLLICVESVFAQKVDIDRQRFTVQRTLPPRNPAASEYTVISPLARTSPITRRYVDNEFVESQIRVDGFQTVFGVDEAIHVDFWLSNFEILSTDFEKRVVEKKDKEGKVTSTQTFYKHVMNYNLDHYYTVALPNGEPLYASASAFTKRSLQHVSDEFNTYKGAANYWKNNRENIVSEAIMNYVNNSISGMNRFLSFEIGFTRQNYGSSLWIMDSKKHPENETHKMHTMNLINALKTLEYDHGTDGIMGEVGASLEYFENLSSMKVGDKHSKKLVKSALVNLAEFYYLMDNPLKCKGYAQELIDRSIDKGDGKSLISKANRLNDLFEINGIYSTHFVRAMDELPDRNTSSPQVAVPAKVVDQGPKYYNALVLTSDGKEYEGFVINDFGVDAWKIQNGIRFVPKNLFKEGAYSKKDVEKLKPSEVSQLAMNDKLYMSTSYADAEKVLEGNPLGARAKKRIVEVISEGNYTLCEFYSEPPSTTTLDAPEYISEPHIIVLEKGADKAERLSTKYIEELLEEQKPTLFKMYKDGKFSINGKPINTKRSLLEKMDIKLGVDENIDYLKIFEALNGN